MEDQESLSVQSQFVTRTGVTLEELADQCRARFGECFAAEPGPWEDVTADVKSRWMSAVEEVGEFVGQEVETSFRLLARRFSVAYYASDRWGNCSFYEKGAFEACARHVTNMVTAEDAADLKDALEFSWGEWILNWKLDPIKEN